MSKQEPPEKPSKKSVKKEEPTPRGVPTMDELTKLLENTDLWEVGKSKETIESARPLRAEVQAHREKEVRMVDDMKAEEINGPLWSKNNRFVNAAHKAWNDFWDFFEDIFGFFSLVGLLSIIVLSYLVTWWKMFTWLYSQTHLFSLLCYIGMHIGYFDRFRKEDRASAGEKGFMALVVFKTLFASLLTFIFLYFLITKYIDEAILGL
jgi:hypothetical protein